MIQEWLDMLLEEKRQKELGKIEEFCKRYEITEQELAMALTKTAENLKKVWEKNFESIRLVIEHLATLWQE